MLIWDGGVVFHIDNFQGTQAEEEGDLEGENQSFPQTFGYVDWVRKIKTRDFDVIFNRADRNIWKYLKACRRSHCYITVINWSWSTVPLLHNYINVIN